MKNKKNSRNIIFLILSVSFLLSVLSFSCKNNNVSFSTALDEIDLDISNESYDSALDLLKKVIDKAEKSYDYISIYKRYMQLNKADSAEKVLKKGLSMIPDNPELLALYTKLLLQEKRNEEAYTLSKMLEGTKYGSLHSEAVLKNYETKHSKQDFFSNELYSIYLDAYNASKDPLWLKNCAILDMKEGNGKKAISIIPSAVKTAENAYFWALVMYDNGYFVEAVNYLNQAQKLKLYSKEVSPIEITALLSDAYLKLGNVEKAETTRENFLSKFDQSKITENDSYYLKILYFNDGYSEFLSNKLEACRNTVLRLVQQWPDYVPGLLLYADFAYKSNKNLKDDFLTRSVRAAGMESRDMKKVSDEPRIPISDAVYKLETCYEKTKNPVIYIKKYDLERKVNTSLTRKQQIAEIYQMMEKNLTNLDTYPSVIVSYAVGRLIAFGFTQNAYNIFKRYVINKYDFIQSESFYDQIIKTIKKMDLWECRYAAYFAAVQKKTVVALKLYEYIVNESISNNKNEYISPVAGWEDENNLAMIYSSIGRRDKAVTLYSKAISYTIIPDEKAESLYRLGCIQQEQDKNSDALRSFKYCVALNPDHAKAQQKLRSLK